MYKGEASEGLEFYNLLYESNKFTSELGKIVLSSGKLEANLKRYLRSNNVRENIEKATLGKLISLANKYNLLNKNEKVQFEVINNQRNYLMHNLYSLFSDLIEETILQKKELLDSDVSLYIEKAGLLNIDLNDFSEMINNK